MVKTIEQGYSSEDKDISMCYDYISKKWIVYSRVPSNITKLFKLYPDKVEIIEQLESGKPVLVRVILPREAVSFRKLLTQEQKEKKSKIARERMLNWQRNNEKID
ncbi:hypothetical protein MUA31_09975 [Staphylococcus simulans]|uniref:hypothetical protein n=1 Tax=Staphylococcus simulans TaxID=1286 RepID=UPI0021D2FE6D|nr:hypothetical protein [Staphylococcus simulans]UXR34706.1 hypothetical protein MUA31_09975 [Staphylococcus simulans]